MNKLSQLLESINYGKPDQLPKLSPDLASLTYDEIMEMCKDNNSFLGVEYNNQNPEDVVINNKYCHAPHTTWHFKDYGFSFIEEEGGKHVAPTWWKRFFKAFEYTNGHGMNFKSMAPWMVHAAYGNKKFQILVNPMFTPERTESGNTATYSMKFDMFAMNLEKNVRETVRKHYTLWTFDAPDDDRDACADFLKYSLQTFQDVYDMMKTKVENIK